MIRKEICELIQRRLAGGDPTDDFPVTLQEINLWLDQAVAASAMRNYADSVNVDGIEFVGDAYYTTFKNIVLARDSVTRDFFGTLPAMPVGVPRGHDISAAHLQITLPAPGLSAPLVRMNPQQLSFAHTLPYPSLTPRYWVEGNQIYVRGFDGTDYTGRSITIRMIGSAGRRLLTDELLIPSDYLPFVIEYIMKNFLPTQNGPKDTINDGNDIK
jgi:hypothetical protein